MHNVYKVIKNGNGSHAGVDRRGFGTKQDFIPLFSFMYVQILWQGQKANLTILEFEHFDTFYSKFQLVSTVSIRNKFCVENWLLCCDLSCKWVTCRSGCKRFWKSALHLWNTPIGDKDQGWFIGSSSIDYCWVYDVCESDTSVDRLKVRFAVTSHKCKIKLSKVSNRSNEKI